MCDTIDSNEAIRRWDMSAGAWADAMTDDGDPARIVLLNPALLRLLPEVKGARVLDAGCGEGYLCRKLAAMGAEVTGVDFSRRQLDVARDRTDPALGIRYVHGNCERLEAMDTGSYDIVVSNIVLQDLADYRAALASFHRVLVQRGTLVLAILHPCFTTPGSGWVRDSEGRKLHWKVDSYFTEGPYELPWPPGADEGVLLFHRTLSNYLVALLQTGFELLDVVEPKPAEAMLAEHPDYRDDVRMCHFILFKALKR